MAVGRYCSTERSTFRECGQCLSIFIFKTDRRCGSAVEVNKLHMLHYHTLVLRVRAVQAFILVHSVNSGFPNTLDEMSRKLKGMLITTSRGWLLHVVKQRYVKSCYFKGKLC